jgi:hypothetical protein
MEGSSRGSQSYAVGRAGPPGPLERCSPRNRKTRFVTGQKVTMQFEVERVVPNTLVRSGFAATRWGQRVPPPSPFVHERDHVQKMVPAKAYSLQLIAYRLRFGNVGPSTQHEGTVVLQGRSGIP